MAQNPNPGSNSETSKPEEARSGGDRTAAGSNYGDWHPKSPAPDSGASPGDAALPPGAGLGNPPDPEPGQGTASGVTPSTAPSGIGSTPHK